jgi:hypothetical protein
MTTPDEIGGLGFGCFGQQPCYVERVAGVERAFAGLWREDMDGAVRTLGERLAQGARDALGAGAEHDNLAALACTLLQLQRFFERIGVRLVHRPGEIALVDAATIGVET